MSTIWIVRYSMDGKENITAFENEDAANACYAWINDRYTGIFVSKPEILIAYNDFSETLSDVTRSNYLDAYEEITKARKVKKYVWVIKLIRGLKKKRLIFDDGENAWNAYEHLEHRWVNIKVKKPKKHRLMYKLGIDEALEVINDKF